MDKDIEKMNNKEKESVQILEKRIILGKEFTIYGTFDEPLFLAKEIAEFIDHNKPSEMIQNIDEDEKLIAIISHSGQNREMWFLAENGLYEVLMQSRKENAKSFKKEIKSILKTIRKTGSYSLPKPMSAMELLELQYKALQETRTEMKQMVEEVKEEIHDFQEGISEFKEEIIEFKEEMPLLAIEIEKITKAKNRAIVDILGGKYSNAYKDRSLRSMVYSDLQKELSRQFGVKSYKAIRRNECNKALELIANYKPPLYLKREIDNANNQLRL